MSEDGNIIKRGIIEHKYLIALIAISVTTLALKYIAQLVEGPGWDTYSFILNALDYSGGGLDYYEYDRGPFFPFVVSLFFRLGFVSEKTAMIVDAAFHFLGVVFLYLLVSLKFKKWIAFLSGMIFLSAKIMIMWGAVGYADIASVALSIMTLYFFIRGMDGNPRFLLLAWPLALCSFLSRTTAALILLPMAFYYLFVPIKNKRMLHNILGIVLGSLLFLPVARFYYIKGADPFFYVKMIFSGLSASGESVGVDNVIYSRGTYYFIDELKNYLVNGHLYPILAVIVLLGSFMLLFKFITVSRKRSNTIILFVFFSILVYFLFEKLSFMQFGILIFLIMGYLYFHSNPNDEDRRVLFVFVMVLWGFSYFMFHSTFYQKVPRYYITMMPSIAFLATLCVVEFSNVLGAVLQKKRLVLLSLTSFLFISMVISSSEIIYDTYNLDETDSVIVDYNAKLDMGGWIEWNINDFDDSLIYSDDWVFFGWYTKTKILSMPFYFDDDYFNHELMKYDVDYYITHKPVQMESAMLLYEVESYRFLKIVDYVELPKGLYIGSGWENYFEYVMRFNSYLLDGDTHVRQASDYIDDFSPEELKEYDYIALFNFKWNDASHAEDLLQEYVDDGGTLIIDCSGNFSDPVYSLNYKQFFDMMVIREELPMNSDININQNGNNFQFSSFADESSEWYGATYEPIDGGIDLDIVATANSNILAAIESYGNGKILWLGFNPIFHSFLSENEFEMEFMQYLFDLAVNS